MSLKNEQCNALLKAQTFLRELLREHKGAWTKKELRERAYSCLRHFPCLGENGMPYFSQDPFTDEHGRPAK
jgi:hypothetical protein